MVGGSSLRDDKGNYRHLGGDEREGLRRGQFVECPAVWVCLIFPHHEIGCLAFMAILYESCILERCILLGVSCQEP